MNKSFYSLLIIAFSLITNHVVGQIPNTIINEVTGEQFNVKDFSNTSSTWKQNAGVYHFGESEAEWDLMFIPYNDSLSIQVWYGSWAEELGLKKQGWVNICQTYNNVRIEGDAFYFGKYSGRFVDYNIGEKKSKSVILYSDPIQGRNYQKDTAEVGFYSYTLDTYFNNSERYQLSKAIQSEKFFSSKSKQELKILRNIVFANYGLIFQQGGEMEKYFSKKEWYTGFLKDASIFLTSIELKNLELLKRYE